MASLIGQRATTVTVRHPDGRVMTLKNCTFDLHVPPANDDGPHYAEFSGRAGYFSHGHEDQQGQQQQQQRPAPAERVELARLRQENELLRRMVADLQEDSLAFRLGREDEHRRVQQAAVEYLERDEERRRREGNSILDAHLYAFARGFLKQFCLGLPLPPGAAGGGDASPSALSQSLTNNQRLADALAPFAAWQEANVNVYGHREDDSRVLVGSPDIFADGEESRVTVGDFRRARAAYAQVTVGPALEGGGGGGRDDDNALARRPGRGVA